MKIFCKTLTSAIILLMVHVGTAQEVVSMLDKSFSINENTQLLLEINGKNIEIIKSPDNLLHVKYSFEFFNQSKKVKRRFTEKFNLQDTVSNNLIKLSNKNAYSSRFGSFKNHFYSSRDTTSSSVKRKKIVDLENLISTELGYRSFYERYIQTKYKNDSESRSKLMRKYERSRRKYTNKKFTIYLPKGLSLDITGIGTTLIFKGKIDNKLNIKLKNGRFYADKLDHPQTVIDLDNSPTFIVSLNGGRLVFDSVKVGFLGSISNVVIGSSYSNIDILEFRDKSIINDFSSTYLLHNNQKKPSSLEMNTEYSKVHYFNPNNNSGTKLYGNDIKIVNFKSDPNLKKESSNEYPLLYNSDDALPKSNAIKMSYGIFYMQ